MLISIDPGVTGGIAIWDSKTDKLLDVIDLEKSDAASRLRWWIRKAKRIKAACEAVKMYSRGNPTAVIALAENAGGWMDRVMDTADEHDIPCTMSRVHPNSWQAPVKRRMGFAPPRDSNEKKKYYGEYLWRFYRDHYRRCLGSRGGYRDGMGDSVCIGLYVIGHAVVV